MGRKRGPAPKPGRRQGHRKGAEIVPIGPRLARGPVGRSEIPPPPTGLLKATRDRWAVLWASDVATLIEDVDLAVAHRLFVCYDEWERALRGYRKNRLVAGSMGQPVLNPLGAQLLALGKEISRLEADLGLSPLARQKLGLAAAEARLTVLELNRMAEGDEPDEDQDQAIIDAELAEIDEA